MPMALEGRQVEENVGLKGKVVTYKDPKAEIVKLPLGNKTTVFTMENSNREEGSEQLIHFTSFMDLVPKR